MVVFNHMGVPGGMPGFLRTGMAAAIGEASAISTVLPPPRLTLPKLFACPAAALTRRWVWMMRLAPPVFACASAVGKDHRYHARLHRCCWCFPV